jgi:hypothetical protein
MRRPLRVTSAVIVEKNSPICLSKTGCSDHNMYAAFIISVNAFDPKNSIVWINSVSIFSLLMQPQAVSGQTRWRTLAW